MDPQLTPLEIVGLAIRSEEDAAKFYGHIAGLINNEIVRDRYRQMAKEEVSHKKLLERLYKDMAGSESAVPRVPGSPQTAEGGPIPREIANSLESLLKLAITREQEAYRFYEEAAVRASDTRSRRGLEYLADVEKGHEKVLANELVAFHRDRDWYEGSRDQEMLHVGP